MWAWGQMSVLTLFRNRTFIRAMGPWLFTTEQLLSVTVLKIQKYTFRKIKASIKVNGHWVGPEDDKSYSFSKADVSNSIFSGNIAGQIDASGIVQNGQGGAVYNAGISTFISKDNSCVGNRATFGGAIFNGSTYFWLASIHPAQPGNGENLATFILSGENTFKSNLASYGGAIQNRTNFQDTKDSHTFFIKNTGRELGGAFSNYGNFPQAEIGDIISRFVGHVEFIGNKSLGNGGGAIANWRGTKQKMEQQH